MIYDTCITNNKKIMFNKEKIALLERAIQDLKEDYFEMYKEFERRLYEVEKTNKLSYMWEIKEEDYKLMQEGKKMKKIRKILN